MDGPWCTIEVEDTGCGNSPDVLPKIFDPFFTTKGQGEGTGLGLSVSLGIVERHGGEVGGKSQGGRGATFTRRVPALAVPALVGEEGWAAPPPHCLVLGGATPQRSSI